MLVWSVAGAIAVPLSILVAKMVTTGVFFGGGFGRVGVESCIQAMDLDVPRYPGIFKLSSKRRSLAYILDHLLL